MAAAEPFWLTGNLAPTFEEHTITELEVSGAIPPELNGLYVRNGPNPTAGWTAHWFLGQGMVHGVALKTGRAMWYRNRFVRTPLYFNPNEPRVKPKQPMDRRYSLANTHVIRHAGKILALEEGSFPWVISDELETLSPWNFEGRLRTAMTAHPRICPITGELLFFAYDALPPYVTYHRAAADGSLVQTEAIQAKGATMMHDWHVTRNFVVFMDLPLVYDLSLLTAESIKRGTPPIRWNEKYGARLGVMPRTGTSSDMVWYEIEPCYVFHSLNAYEDGEKMVIDVARFPNVVLDDANFPKTGFGPAEPGVEPAVLHRWTINRTTGKVSSEALDDRPAEFPQIPQHLVGLRHRYGYMMATTCGSVHDFGQELYKYDLERGRSWTFRLPPGETAGEPTVAHVGPAEDDGYVLTFIYNRKRGTSDLGIIDASDFEKGTVARIHLPCRVPDGFHGSWMPDRLDA
jgi:carotenoid cleavage dioxygenase-like enzyme